MSKSSNLQQAAALAWVRPQLERLGTIRDVRGTGVAATQGSNKT